MRSFWIATALAIATAQGCGAKKEQAAATGAGSTSSSAAASVAGGTGSATGTAAAVAVVATGTAVATSTSVAACAASTAITACTIATPTSAEGEIEACITSAPCGSVVELPPGTYVINSQIQLLKPITLRTAGTGPGTAYAKEPCYVVPTGSVDNPGYVFDSNPNIGSRNSSVPCATLIAGADLNNPGGVVYAGPTVPPDNAEPTGAVSNITVDHLIVDANQSARWSGPARAAYATATTTWAQTAVNALTFKNCSNCAITNSAALHAVTWACMSWYQSPSGTIANSVFSNCGQRNPVPPSYQNITIPLIANGIDFKSSADNVQVLNNAFIDDTDVALGFDTESAVNVQVKNNYFATTNQLLHAQVMFDGQPQRYKPGQECKTSGQTKCYDGTIVPPVTDTPLAPSDYTGGVVAGNYFNCNGRCDFAVLIGSGPWQATLPPAVGLYVHDNIIDNARRGIELEPAGTAAAQIEMDRNLIRTPYAATIAFGSTFGLNGADLVNPAGQFVAVNCWQQDPTQCVRDANNVAVSPCCSVNTVSAFDAFTSFYKSSSNAPVTAPGAVTNYGTMSHCGPSVVNGALLCNPALGPIGDP